MNKLQRIIGTGMIALAGLGFAGCKEHRIEYSPIKKEIATVTWKKHKDDYTMMILVPITIGKTTTLVPRAMYIPEKNDIVFMGEQNFNLNNKEIFGRFNVGDDAEVSYKETYHTVYDNIYGDKEKELIAKTFLGCEFIDATPTKQSTTTNLEKADNF